MSAQRLRIVPCAERPRACGLRDANPEDHTTVRAPRAVVVELFGRHRHSTRALDAIRVHNVVLALGGRATVGQVRGQVPHITDLRLGRGIAAAHEAGLLTVEPRNVAVLLSAGWINKLRDLQLTATAPCRVETEPLRRRGGRAA